MISSWLVYFVLMLDNFITLFVWISGLSIFLVACFILRHLASDGQYSLRPCKFPFAIFCISLVVIAFIPTTQQAAAIYLIPKVINSKSIQDTAQSFKSIPPQLLNLFNDYVKNLDSSLKSKLRKDSAND